MLSNLISNILSKIKKKLGKDKDFKEIAKGGSTAFIINCIGLATGYIFVLLISRIYKSSATEIYGQYVIITVLLRIGSIVARLGTDTAMLQSTAALAAKGLYSNIIENNAKLLKLLCLSALAVTVIMLVLYQPLAKLFHLPEKILAITSVFILPMALGLYYSQSLRGLKKIGLSSFLRSSSLPVLNFILLPLILIFYSDKMPGYNNLPAFTYFLSIVITAVIGFFYWRKYVPKSEPSDSTYDPAVSKTIPQLFKSSYPFLLAESMVFIVVWVDQLMLGLMGTNSDVGIFNVCVKYAMVASLFLQAVNTIAAPKFSEYFSKNDFKGLAKNVQQTTKSIFWATIPIVVVYLCLPKFLLGIFGPAFKSGWLAFIFLTIGALVNVMTGSVGILLQMTNNQKTLQNILMITVLIEIVLNYILIPIYGVTGAAIASLICSCIHNFAMVYYIKKYFNFYSVYPRFSLKL